jgi:hypothetical protein
MARPGHTGSPSGPPSDAPRVKVRPSRISAATPAITSVVRRLSAPTWSLSPQRPQLRGASRMISLIITCGWLVSVTRTPIVASWWMPDGRSRLEADGGADAGLALSLRWQAYLVFHQNAPRWADAPRRASAVV